MSVKAQLHCSPHGLELLKITHISNGFFTWGVNFDWLRSVILFCSLKQKKKSFLSVCVVSVKAQLHCSPHGLELLKITHISKKTKLSILRPK